MLHSPISVEPEVKQKSDSTEITWIYNDSIDNILMHPSNVKMYQIISFVSDSVDARQADSLFNYPIYKKIGKIKKDEKILLHFVISDLRQYRKDYPPVRQPFNPDFALEFTKGKETAYYFVSFGTGEIAIADIVGQFKFFLMNDSRIMERWYAHILLKRAKNNSKR